MTIGQIVQWAILNSKGATETLTHRKCREAAESILLMFPRGADHMKACVKANCLEWRILTKKSKWFLPMRMVNVAPDGCTVQDSTVASAYKTEQHQQCLTLLPEATRQQAI